MSGEITKPEIILGVATWIDNLYKENQEMKELLKKISIFLMNAKTCIAVHAVGMKLQIIHQIANSLNLSTINIYRRDKLTLFLAVLSLILTL